jgi:hypothetical protein
MQQVILILFGWVIGVFSSIILENQKRKQAKEDYKESLFTELDLVYPRIVSTYYAIIKEMGQLNKENLEWMHNIISKKNSKSLDTIDDTIIKILKYNDKEIKLLNKKLQDTRTLSLKKFNLSFLQENISSFSLLDKEFRFDAINIRTNINYLNDSIDKVDFFYKTTFVPDISENNYNVAYMNIKNYYINIKDLCKRTSEMIVNI